jgi:hypothetical protein
MDMEYGIRHLDKNQWFAMACGQRRHERVRVLMAACANRITARHSFLPSDRDLDIASLISPCRSIYF